KVSIEGDGEFPATQRVAQPARDMKVWQIDDGPRVGREPRKRAVGQGPGKNAVRVGVDEPLRRKSTACAEEAVRRGKFRRRKESRRAPLHEGSNPSPAG